MAKQTIGIGSALNDGTGDPIRTAFDKTNDNFDELYSQAVPGRTELKALTGMTDGDHVILTAPKRFGLFRWTTGDYSTEIATDTEEGVYIKADDTASSAGAWIRETQGATYDVDWFGADPTGVSSSVTAWQGAIDVLEAVYGGGTIIAAGVAYLFDGDLRVKKPIYFTSGRQPGSVGTSINSNIVTVLNAASGATDLITFKAENVSEYIGGFGVNGFFVQGNNVLARAYVIDGHYECSMTNLRAQKLTDAHIDVIDENRLGGIGGHFENIRYDTGASQLCEDSVNIRVKGATWLTGDHISATVMAGANIDLYETDSCYFGHCQGGLTGGNKAVASVADNGSGDARFTCTAHGFFNGQKINMFGWAESTYNADHVAAVIDANTFDVTGLSYVVDSSTSGVARPAGHNIVTRGQKTQNADNYRVALSSVADNGSGNARFTTGAAHGFYVGQTVGIGGTTNYEGNSEITAVPTTTTFDTGDSYSAESLSGAYASSLRNCARRNTFGWVAGYAPSYCENSDVDGRPHPHNTILAANGEGATVEYDSDANGQGVLNVRSIIAWQTGEHYSDRVFPMRDTLWFGANDAAIGSAVTRSDRGTNRAPTLEFGASVGTANNFATWFRPQPHWDAGTIKTVTLFWTSNTDGTNTFDIDVKLACFGSGFAPTTDTPKTITPQVSAANNILNLTTITFDTAYTKGDSIALYVDENGTADTATVSFALYGVEIEYESDGPPALTAAVGHFPWLPSPDRSGYVP